MVRGRRLYLNRNDLIVSREIAIHGEYEPTETAHVLRLVGSGDTVVDVGAHIGYFTLLLSSAVGPDGRVISLEPDPENYSFLRRTVAELPDQNVELHHVAAWKRDEDLPWHRSEENTGDHSLLGSTDRSTTATVEARSLDSLIPSGTAIDFMKVDVQGVEGAVLDGMERIMRESPPRVLLLEFMPSELITAGYDPEELFGRLLQTGYTIRMISHYYNIDETITSYAPIREHCVEDWKFVNLLCVVGDGSQSA